MDISTPNTATPAATQGAALELEQLLASTQGIHTAVLTTADGFAVAATGTNAAQADKLAATSSAIHALGAAIAKETGVAPCQVVVVEGASGVILVVELPDAQHGMLLAVVTSEHAILGELRWATKAAAERIERLFAS